MKLPSGSAVSDWLSAQVMISSLESKSAVVLEGNSNNGGFAIDDLKLTPVSQGEKCPTRPKHGQTSVGVRASDIFGFINESQQRNLKDNFKALTRFRNEHKSTSNADERNDSIVF